MRDIVYSNRFRKDFRLALKQGKNCRLLEETVHRLANDEILEPRFRNHKLIAQYLGFWECHIAPDFLLIYDLREDELELVRCGTHSELFK